MLLNYDEIMIMIMMIKILKKIKLSFIMIMTITGVSIQNKTLQKKNRYHQGS